MVRLDKRARAALRRSLGKRTVPRQVTGLGRKHVARIVFFPEHGRLPGRTVRVEVLHSDASAVAGERDHVGQELLRRRLVDEDDAAVDGIEWLVGDVRQRVGLNQLHPGVRSYLLAGYRQQSRVTIDAKHARPVGPTRSAICARSTPLPQLRSATRRRVPRPSASRVQAERRPYISACRSSRRREEQLGVDWRKPLEQNVRLCTSDLAETEATIQGSRPVRVQRSQLNGDAASNRVLQYLLQDRRAYAAVLELGTYHQFAQVDEVRTVLNADIPDWHAIAFDNLMRRGIPAASEVGVLCGHVPGAELAFPDLATGLAVHAAPEFGMGR
jgi:hypothetical protein